MEVSVTVGSQSSPLTTTSDDCSGAWSVDVPENASYITGTSVTVTVSATKNDLPSPSDVERTVTVDLIPPTASYSAPADLQVGVAITGLAPTNAATDIASYAAMGPPLGAEHRRRNDRRHHRHPGHRRPPTPPRPPR